MPPQKAVDVYLRAEEADAALEECSQTDVLAMLAAVEACLSANAIRSVGIELDGSKYMMAPSQVSR